jgi:hypothetical protein
MATVSSISHSSVAITTRIRIPISLKALACPCALITEPPIRTLVILLISFYRKIINAIMICQHPIRTVGGHFHGTPRFQSILHRNKRRQWTEVLGESYTNNVCYIALAECAPGGIGDGNFIDTTN